MHFRRQARFDTANDGGLQKTPLSGFPDPASGVRAQVGLLNAVALAASLERLSTALHHIEHSFDHLGVVDASRDL